METVTIPKSQLLDLQNQVKKIENQIHYIQKYPNDYLRVTDAYRQVLRVEQLVGNLLNTKA